MSKEEEYLELVATKDRMVEMQALAAKAGEEFAVLANENDRLFKENCMLKERFDDAVHLKDTLEQQLQALRHKDADSAGYADRFEALRSQADKWHMERQVMLHKVSELKQAMAPGDGDGQLLVGKTALKLHNHTSEDEQRLMKESLMSVMKDEDQVDERGDGHVFGGGQEEGEEGELAKQQQQIAMEDVFSEEQKEKAYDGRSRRRHDIVVLYNFNHSVILGDSGNPLQEVER